MTAISDTRDGSTSIEAGHHPAWARWGGGGVVLAATLLLLATVVEAVIAVQPSGFWTALLGVLLLGSAVVYAIAMLPLALGSSGSNGIVGRSWIGRAGLLGFGGLFLAAEVDYFDVVYLLPAADDYSASSSFSLGLGVAQMLLLLVGAIVVVRAGIATGAARWALLVFVIVAAVTGAIASGTADMTTFTIAHLVSTVVQIGVGIVLATGRAAR